MKKFINSHPHFVVLFIIFFGANVLKSLYDLSVKKALISDVAIGLGAGFLATVLVSYVGLKMMGLWRVKDDEDD